ITTTLNEDGSLPPGDDEPEPAPDLVLSVDASDKNPPMGAAIELLVTLTNRGNAPARDVVVESLLETGRFVVMGTSVSQGSYDPLAEIWTVGDVQAGSAVTLTFHVVVRVMSPDAAQP